MNDEAELRIVVSFGPYQSQSRAITKRIAGPFVEAFSPMDVCDDRLLAHIVRGGADLETATIIKMKRENYAKILAKAIAESLAEAMQAEDTKNGYHEKQVSRLVAGTEGGER